jgi:hypothetical protein
VFTTSGGNVAITRQQQQTETAPAAKRGAQPPVVLADEHRRPVLVFARGRTKFHAVVATDTAITLAKLETLRGLVSLERRGEPYPPRRAASFWLNHDCRPITKRARAVLRGLVAKKAAA